MESFRAHPLPALIVGLLCMFPAAGHPMGNFAIAHATSLQLDGRFLRVRYRLDLAEIPAAGEMRLIDADGDGAVSDAEARAYLARAVPQWTAAQSLRINGQPAAMEVISSDLQLRAGAADAPTLLFTVDYLVAVERTRSLYVEYADDTWPARSGWREISARAWQGWRIAQSDVPVDSTTGMLDAYPTDVNAVAPRQTRARVVFEPAEGAAAVPPASAAPRTSTPVPATPRDRLPVVIGFEKLSPPVLIASFLLAGVLGGFRALSSGHEMTANAARLVGERQTPKHAVLLAAIAALRDVAGVFALGVLVLFVSKHVLPERFDPWLGFVCGLAIAATGVWQFTGRPAVGVAGRMVPCPSALVVMLIAIALHHVALGLGLIIAFGFGLFVWLVVIGRVIIRARQGGDGVAVRGARRRRFSVVWAVGIAALGVAIAAGSIRGPL